ncbi:MAG TPA: two-component regulator propeller domain-containing protein [Acidobacteriota bacterium]|nr:two-component regulator propeller domain-containing protein [Acidobacteriota bacterium]
MANQTVQMQFLTTLVQVDQAWGKVRLAAFYLAIVYLGCLLFSVTVQAQLVAFRFDRFGVDQGLSSQIVTCVLRDHVGYLWIGTESGLNRYDGYTFKVFLPNPKDKKSLRDGSITTVFEDHYGNIWVGTKDGGLHLFDRYTETFHVFQQNPGQSNGLSDNRIYQLYEDPQGVLWIGNVGGLDKIVWDGKTVESIRFTSFRSDPNNPNSLSHSRVTSIVRDQAGTLWVGTRLGLNRMISENPPRFERFLHDATVPTSLPDNEIYSFLLDREGNLWIGTWGGGGLSKIPAAELSKAQPAFLQFPYDATQNTGLEVDVVFDLSEDAQGNIWLCCRDQGMRYLGRDEQNRPNPRFLSLVPDPGNPFSLASGTAMAMCQDQQGLIWIANLEGGLLKYDPAKSAFHLYRHHPGDVPSLPEGFVTGVAEDRDGSIWVGGSGLTEIVPAGDAFSQPSYIRYLPKPGDPTALQAEDISTLITDSRGRLWVGTISSGLFLGRRQSNRMVFTNYRRDPKDPHSLGNNAILALLEDSHGTVWVGTYQGLYALADSTSDQPKAVFTAYRHRPDDPGSLSSDMIEALAEGPDRHIWIGTGSGLNRLDPSTGQMTRYLHDPNNPASINHEFIDCLYRASTGLIWVGTRAGLCWIDPTTGKLSRVPVETGLAEFAIMSVVEDASGAFWVGTINGLFRFDPPTGHTLRFGKNDGLPHELLDRGVVCSGKGGRLYFGTPEGVISFRPEEITQNPMPPSVVLTELLLGNQIQPIRAQSTLPAQINLLETLVLQHTDNLFTIEFSALNFKQPEDNRYAYKLEGLYNDWITTDAKNRRATFTNLEHGEYVFRVKAANNDGVWNEAGPMLKIVILPPWWKTWWARLIFYTTGILIVLAVPVIRLVISERQRVVLETQVQQRTLELSQANQKLMELDRYKQAMMSMIVHDLKNPLSAILHDGTDKPPEHRLQQIKRFATQMLYLVLNILDVQKFQDAKFELNLQGCRLADIFHQAIDDVDFLRKNKGQIFEIEVDETLEIQVDEAILRRVIVNLLTNAIKFTPVGGTITVKGILDATDSLRLTIQDSGEGIPKEKQALIFEPYGQVQARASGSVRPTGLGLAFCKLAIEAHGGTIGVESEVGNGALFWMMLPTVTRAQQSIAPVQLVLGETGDLALSAEAVEVLRPFLNELASLEIFEVTALRRLLKTIPTHISPELQMWKDAVDLAIQTGNESRFQALLHRAQPQDSKV